ncbi:MAG TPA: NAD(P)/FAD-dependent oxidoreductase [Polyangiaceae bacterium]|jgi:phytoene dehydrogenase-like protein
MKKVVVIGGGHNGLAAAVLLAQGGASVRVVEGKKVLGGAVRTERPFAKAPNLGASTGAYLLGLMPPELKAKLELDVRTIRRDPHYFLPTTDGRHLLFGSDAAATRDQMVRFFSQQDYDAYAALQDEIEKIRDDVAPTWLEEPLSIENTAEKYVRSALRTAFVDLCRKPISHYLARFGFKSELLMAMYATTDAFSGLYGSWDTPGTGMNFLVHNMCRLPGSDGTWMIVEGGMGSVTTALEKRCRSLGVEIQSGDPVAHVRVDGKTARGVVLASGKKIEADAIVCNADPFAMRELVGREELPAEYNDRLDEYAKKPGSTLKVNLALKGTPKFSCLPNAFDKPFGPTIHLLPDEREVIARLREGFAAVQRGELYDFPTIEWYLHTTVDRSLQDREGRHNSALFVQWVPYEIRGSSWEKEEARYVQKLLAICDRFAPGTSDLVVDVFALHPKKIEEHFGITRGHIHHVDNGWGFSDRLPYATPIAGLYSCSAGTHPAGSVIGAAGHNAAMRVLRDLA